jgi:hypothetical protein
MGDGSGGEGYEREGEGDVMEGELARDFSRSTKIVSRDAIANLPLVRAIVWHLSLRLKTHPPHP